MNRPTRKPGSRRRFVTTIDDIRPDDYDGGFIYSQGGQLVMAYVEHYDDDDDKFCRLHTVGHGEITDLILQSADQVAEVCGMTRDQLLRMAGDPGPEHFYAVVAFANVFGWDEVTGWSGRLLQTRGDIRRKFRSWLKRDKGGAR